MGEGDARAEEPPSPRQHRHRDGVVGRDLVQQARDAEVVRLRHGVELVRQVERDDGHGAARLVLDLLLEVAAGGRHGFSLCVCVGILRPLEASWRGDVGPGVVRRL